MMKSTLGMLAVCIAVSACSAPEVTIGAADGVPAITGSSDFSLDQFTCGQMFTTQDGYTVTSVVSGSSCQISFDNVVTILKASDYQNIPELKGASNLVQSIDLDVKTLDFKDATTGMSLDLNSYIETATLTVNGQQVADKSTLAKLPVTVSLTGDALTPMKSQIDARSPATAHVVSTITVRLRPRRRCTSTTTRSRPSCWARATSSCLPAAERGA
jgi:hypothetical protein